MENFEVQWNVQKLAKYRWLPRSVDVQKVEWNSPWTDHELVQLSRHHETGLRSSLGSHGYYVFTLVVSVLTLDIMEVWLFKLNLTLKVKVNRDLNQLKVSRLHRVSEYCVKNKAPWFCTSGPNLMILAGKGDELRCGQAQHGVNLGLSK